MREQNVKAMERAAGIQPARKAGKLSGYHYITPAEPRRF